MIVPQYWAEGRVQHRTEQRQVTVRRFGWSDASQAEAHTHAGVPIREEILSRHGSAILTRNLYGAQCLNTPDVLFAHPSPGASASPRTSAHAPASGASNPSTSLAVASGWKTTSACPPPMPPANSSPTSATAPPTPPPPPCNAYTTP
jgi:hypothetical protein